MGEQEKWFNNVYVVELLGYTGGKVGILQSSVVRRDERIFPIRGKSDVISMEHRIY